MTVEEICDAWIKAGLADECFWEGWEGCPTPGHELTPRMVMEALSVVAQEEPE